jgi:hypothetical protein
MGVHRAAAAREVAGGGVRLPPDRLQLVDSLHRRCLGHAGDGAGPRTDTGRRDRIAPRDAISDVADEIEHVSVTLDGEAV